MLVKPSCLSIVFYALISCQGESIRSDGSEGSGGAPQNGTNTGTTTSTLTDTSTSTVTSTDTHSSTSVDTNTSPPTPLIINGKVVTADQLSDCPNNLCLLTEDPTVKNNRLSYSPSPTSSADIGTGSVSIKNYFQMVCLASSIIDRWKPVKWENCTNTNVEKFYIETVKDGFFYIHPAAQHNLCIESPGSPIVTGVQLVLNTCDASQSQAFTNEVSGAVSFYHPALDDTLCVVRGGDSVGNLTIGLWTCDPNNTNMMFHKLLK